MRVLYYAYTQLHIFNIINLRQNVHSKASCDLIILNKNYTGVSNILPALKKTRIFERILELDNYRPAADGIKKVFVHTNEMVNAQKNRKKIHEFLANKEYDLYFTFGSNLESYLVFHEINKVRKVKYCVYEEGVGTYYNTLENMLKPWNKVFLNALKISMPKYPNELWVLQPTWLVNKIPDECVVNQMPLFHDTQLINKIWNYKQNDVHEKTILLEQPINGLEKMQAALFHIVKRDASIVKMHPRSLNQELYSDLKIMESNNVMWEIICLNNNLNQKVLISFFSTACLSPKSIMGYEPIIIFLYKMKEFNRPLNEKNLQLIEKFISSYSDSSRIYTPECVEDFQIILKKLDLLGSLNIERKS